MQQCPDCGRIYDESESATCPFCYDFDDRETYHIVYDHDKGEALSLAGEDYEEFKRQHPDWC